MLRSTPCNIAARDVRDVSDQVVDGQWDWHLLMDLISTRCRSADVIKALKDCEIPSFVCATAKCSSRDLTTLSTALGGSLEIPSNA